MTASTPDEPKWVVTAGGKPESCTGCGIFDREPRWKLYRGAVATCCYCVPCIEEILSEEQMLKVAS